jgi:hypothetical protein
MTRPIVTGTILTTFSEPVATPHSHFSRLPRELGNLTDQVAKMKFPIQSKQDLLAKLGGPTASLFIGENVVEAQHALMFLPAHFFPVADAANFAEKLSEYYATRQVGVRRRALNSRELNDLARRFIGENPELVPVLGKAVRTLLDADKSESSDDDKIAGKFLSSNQRFIDLIGRAARGVGRLRAKSKEDLEEEGKQ